MYRTGFRMARAIARPSRIRAAFRKPYLRRPKVYRRKKTANKVHSFVRWCDKDTQFGTNSPTGTINETGNDQHQSYEFRLTNLVNVSDFTNLYDMYKINKIQLLLEPAWDQTVVSGTTVIRNKKIRVVHDYNSNEALTDEDQYLEYANCKSYNPQRTVKITLYPKLNNKVEGNLGTDAYTSFNSNKVWLNIANANVPHFGLKVFIPEDIVNTEGVLLFRVRAKYWISLKNSK